MTEKRFYYNTFYHADDMSRVLEYEIIDRQSYPNYPNHDEKEDIPSWYIYIDENDSGWQDMLVDLLNELNDENEELKECNAESSFMIDCFADEEVRLITENEKLKRENEKLKQENEVQKDTIESLTGNIMYAIDHFGMDKVL